MGRKSKLRRKGAGKEIKLIGTLYTSTFTGRFKAYNINVESWWTGVIFLPVNIKTHLKKFHIYGNARIPAAVSSSLWLLQSQSLRGKLSHDPKLGTQKRGSLKLALLYNRSSWNFQGMLCSSYGTKCTLYILWMILGWILKTEG